MAFLIHWVYGNISLERTRSIINNNLPNVLYDSESHAKDGRCGLSKNKDIRRYVGKLVEKHILVSVFKLPDYRSQFVTLRRDIRVKDFY